MDISYVKVNPAENMTIFVLDKVERELHKSISNRLMDYNSIHGEQVGFVEEPETLQGKSIKTQRLQMMGGEFCGNATRSLAALMVYNNYPSIKKLDDKYIVLLEVSGMDGLINCKVRPTNKSNVFYSKIEMPLPQSLSDFKVEQNGRGITLRRIDFLGISHFIVDINMVEDKEKLFNTIKSEMDKSDYDAFGIMYYDYEEEFLTPLVYVKGTDSLYWERSCGSGSTALAIAIAFDKKQSVMTEIKQPGGILVVDIEYSNNEIIKVELDGPVEIVSLGNAYI